MIYSLFELAIILAVLGLWYEFINWITTFLGWAGPFIGVLVPIVLFVVSNTDDNSSLSYKEIILISAVLSVLFMLFIMWNMDYI